MTIFTAQGGSRKGEEVWVSQHTARTGWLWAKDLPSLSLSPSPHHTCRHAHMDTHVCSAHVCTYIHTQTNVQMHMPGVLESRETRVSAPR